MRIALDALPLVSSRMTGIGYCEAGQVQAMMMLHPEEQYVLQFFDKGDGAEKRKRLAYPVVPGNMTVFTCADHARLPVPVSPFSSQYYNN